MTSTIQSIENMQDLVELASQHPSVDWRTFGDVAVKEFEDFLIFSYTPEAQYKDRWNFFERVSRGLIVSKVTKEVVARPFDKFFNWFENGKRSAGHIVNVTEKVDGSLGILYNYGNGYKIATRGSFNSDQALWATDFLNKNYNLTRLPKDLTLLFEIVFPENKVVVNYGDKKGLVLLAARNRHTGEYLPFFPRLVMLADFFGFELVKVSSFNNITDILIRAGQLDLSQEGWVAEMSDGSRWKIKGDRYIEMHKIVSGLTFKRALEAFRTNSVEELLKYVPDEFLSDFKIWLSQIQVIYLSERKKIQGIYDLALASLGPSFLRKDYAIWMKKNCPAGYLQYMFLVFDLQEPKVRDLILQNLKEPVDSKELGIRETNEQGVTRTN